MKNLIALLIMVLLSAKAFAQGKLNSDTSNFKNAPLYVIKIEGETRDYVGNIAAASVNLVDIASLNVFKSKEAVDSLYGEKGRYGVVTITLKKGTQLLPKTELFKKFNIAQKHHVLPVYIDSSLVSANTNIFGVSTINKIVVATATETGKKYISITTVNGKPKPVPKGELRIRG